MNTNSKARAFTDRHASIDELDRAIVNLAAHINAANHDFLVLVRRFDERAGWLQWSLESCADWLHYRCDISKSAAREKVRVAHAMKTLPAIAMSFAEGKLSYSKVRALTRVARPDNEEELLAFALKTTAARVEERCRELRCGTVASTDDAVRAHARRDLRVRFPGCGRKRHVHAHHVVHWSAGGETRLEDLMLLCSKHHTLLHEGGFTIDKDYRGRWFFRRPDGRAVPSCGYRPEDITDDDGGTADQYFERRASAETCIVREPPAVYSLRPSGKIVLPRKRSHITQRTGCHPGVHGRDEAAWLFSGAGFLC